MRAVGVALEVLWCCIVIIIDSVPLGHLLSLPGISMTRRKVRVELVQEHPSDLRDVIASSLAIR